jgi:hypothetical protein
MAEHAGVTCWQVHQIWKATDLKARRLRSFKISNDPHFAEKVNDGVELYMNPLDSELILFVDERPRFRPLTGLSRKFSLE